MKQANQLFARRDNFAQNQQQAYSGYMRCADTLIKVAEMIDDNPEYKESLKQKIATIIMTVSPIYPQIHTFRPRDVKSSKTKRLKYPLNSPYLL